MTAFDRRLAERQDELDWLYMELYDDREELGRLKERMADCYGERSMSLRRLDGRREKDPLWFCRGDQKGMTMYTSLFAGTLSRLEERLDYLTEQGLSLIHI